MSKSAQDNRGWDYTHDRYGRRLPRRTHALHCDDCGHNGMPARAIRFYTTGMLFNVCATHEHEYCGTPAERREQDECGVAMIVPIGWDRGMGRDRPIYMQANGRWSKA